MSAEFDGLNKLVQERKVTIGVQRNHANNFWTNTTLVGKSLNWGTAILLIIAVFVFIKFGLWAGVLSLIAIASYAFLVQKMGSMYVRVQLLQNEELFSAAYDAQSVTIKINSTGNIIRFPIEWKKEFIVTAD